jgi:protein O-GlcNAc transferase
MTIQEALDVALAHHRRGEYQQAEAIYRQILDQHPAHPDALHLLGMIAFTFAHLPEALDLMQRASAANPAVPEYHCDAAVVLDAMGRGADAIEAFEKAIAIKPDHAHALDQLSTVLVAQSQFQRAVDSARRALKIAPQNPVTWNTLGNALIRQGSVEEAIESYRRAIAVDPSFQSAWSNLLLCLHYRTAYTPQQIFQEHLRWAQQLPPAQERQFPNPPPADRPLRIGYLSPDFCGHSVSYFVEPLLQHHDRTRFELFCYSDTRNIDATTQRLRAYPLQWRDTQRLGDADLRSLILQDGIDILVNLAAHAGHNRLPALAQRVAPLQVSFLGYCNTTGLRSIDYRFTDSIADPPGQTESLHTEQLIRIDPCAWCYLPPADAPPVRETDHENITFGCFSALSKVSDEMMALWTRIIDAVPESKLVLKAIAFCEESTRQRVSEQFARHGLTPDRLTLLGPQPNAPEHLRTYHQIDIGLDTYPYHGTTTTCEALWMGVPVISRVGEVHVSRVGASLLSAVGMQDLLAHDDKQYIQVAITLARDRDRLKDLRRTLRHRMQASPLMDEAGYTGRVESTYRAMISAPTR